MKHAALRPTAEVVWERYRSDLALVETRLAEGVRSDVALVGEVANYVLDSGGKRFRPVLVAASARMAGAAEDAEIATLGGVVEYIHTATLLHDDVVDDGDVRRNQDAARVIWGNEASVLVGDYLYARALALAVGLGRLEIVRVLTGAVEEMSEGEVFQLSVCGDTAVSEAIYLRVVELKTASLMSAACQAGGMLGGLSEDQVAALSAYGRNVGIAFQVADDTLDYQADAEVFGKELGKDLRDGKITLPLLYTLERCTPEERKKLQEIVALDDFADPAALAFVHDRMSYYGSIEDALTRARDFSGKAKDALTEAFPDGEHRQALLSLADYVVERDH
ncbi:MAG: polyprenyl synthetase family protein [Leptospirillia bacterium]